MTKPRIAADLRRRLGLIMAAALAAVVLILSLVIGLGVRAMEDTEATEDATRLRTLIAAEVEDLERIARDWAHWDDTWRFAVEGEVSWIEVNCTPESLGNLELAAITVLDAAGGIAFAAAPGLSIDRVSDLLPSSWARRRGKSNDDLSGLVTHAGQPYLFSAHDVLRSDATGDSGGTLVMFRALNEERLQRVSQRLGRPLVRVDEAGPGLRSLGNGISRIRTESGLFVRTRLATQDDSVISLDSELPNHLRRTGLAIGLIAITAMVALAGLGALVLGRLLSGGVTSRLEDLVQSIELVSQLPDTELAIGGFGDDEIGQLAQHLKRALEAQRQANQQALKAGDLAIAASQAKSAFLAHLSHEIRTPLNGILGLTMLLRDRLDDEGTRDQLNIIERCGRELESMLGEVLDLARIEAGRLELSPSPCDAIDVVRHVCGIFVQAAEKAGSRLRCSVQPGMPAQIIADAGRLRQIATNLISNAVKFTANGRIDVELAWRDGRLTLTVSDSGIGIETAAIGRLFTAFGQADASIDGRFGGTGLGLALSRRLARLHGGDLTVRSSIGVGSDFIATIQAGGQPTHDCQTATGLSPVHVVVLGDAPDDATLTELCHGRPWGWTRAANREALHDMLNSGSADAAILDADELAEVELYECCERSRSVILIAPSRPSSAWIAPILLGRPALPRPVSANALLDHLARLLHVPEASGLRRRYRSQQRVLVVDDREVNRLVATSVLERLGLETVQASSGEDAIAQWQRWYPDLIIMDLRMPGLDGVEATKRIRSAEGPAPVPILAMTADSSLETAGILAAAGFDGLLLKPLDPAALIRELDAHLVREDKANAPAQAASTAIIASARDCPSLAERLQELAQQVGDDHLDHVVTALREDLAGGMVALLAAGDDLPALGEAAHCLTGIALNAGLTALAASCREIDILARQGKAEAATRMLPAADAACRDGLAELAQAMAARGQTLRPADATPND